MVASTAMEQLKVPYWLRTRAARFARMQRYRLGERLRAKRRADRDLGVEPPISHLVRWVVSAAAFLAVSGVELTLPWPDDFTKQMALTPPCFLLAQNTTTNDTVNGGGGGREGGLEGQESSQGGEADAADPFERRRSNGRTLLGPSPELVLERRLVEQVEARQRAQQGQQQHADKRHVDISRPIDAWRSAFAADVAPPGRPLGAGIPPQDSVHAPEFSEVETSRRRDMVHVNGKSGADPNPNHNMMNVYQPADHNRQNEREIHNRRPDAAVPQAAYTLPSSTLTQGVDHARALQHLLVARASSNGHMPTSATTAAATAAGGVSKSLSVNASIAGSTSGKANGGVSPLDEDAHAVVAQLQREASFADALTAAPTVISSLQATAPSASPASTAVNSGGMSDDAGTASIAGQCGGCHLSAAGAPAFAPLTNAPDPNAVNHSPLGGSAAAAAFSSHNPAVGAGKIPHGDPQASWPPTLRGENAANLIAAARAADAKAAAAQDAKNKAARTAAAAKRVRNTAAKREAEARENAVRAAKASAVAAADAAAIDGIMKTLAAGGTATLSESDRSTLLAYGCGAGGSVFATPAASSAGKKRRGRPKKSSVASASPGGVAGGTGAITPVAAAVAAASAVITGVSRPVTPVLVSIKPAPSSGHGHTNGVVGGVAPKTIGPASRENVNCGGGGGDVGGSGVVVSGEGDGHNVGDIAVDGGQEVDGEIFVGRGRIDAKAEGLSTEPLVGWSGEVAVELGVWTDTRACILCKEKGDDPESGRLLPLDDGTWVHTHCGLWSSEVYEKPSEAVGIIRELYKARSRGRALECSLCRNIGATVDCKTSKCDEVFHFKCAMDAGCVFFADKTLACPLHRPDGVEDADGNTVAHFGSSLTVTAETETTSTVNDAASETASVAGEGSASVSGSTSASVVTAPAPSGDAEAISPATRPEKRGTLRWQLVQDPPKYMEAQRRPGNPKLPSWDEDHALRIGALTIHKLGKLSSETPGSHSKHHVYPAGFRSSRIFWSQRRPLQRTLYICEVVEGSKLTPRDLDTADIQLGCGGRRGGAPPAASSKTPSDKPAAPPSSAARAKGKARARVDDSKPYDKKVGGKHASDHTASDEKADDHPAVDKNADDHAASNDLGADDHKASGRIADVSADSIPAEIGPTAKEEQAKEKEARDHATPVCTDSLPATSDPKANDKAADDHPAFDRTATDDTEARDQVVPVRVESVRAEDHNVVRHDQNAPAADNDTLDNDRNIANNDLDSNDVIMAEASDTLPTTTTTTTTATASVIIVTDSSSTNLQDGAPVSPAPAPEDSTAAVTEKTGTDVVNPAGTNANGVDAMEVDPAVDGPAPEATEFVEITEPVAATTGGELDVKGKAAVAQAGVVNTAATVTAGLGVEAGRASAADCIADASSEVVTRTTVTDNAPDAMDIGPATLSEKTLDAMDVVVENGPGSVTSKDQEESRTGEGTAAQSVPTVEDRERGEDEADILKHPLPTDVPEMGSANAKPSPNPADVTGAVASAGGGGDASTGVEGAEIVAVVDNEAGKEKDKEKEKDEEGEEGWKWWGDKWSQSGTYEGMVFRVTVMDEPERAIIDSDLERLYHRIVEGVSRCWKPLRERDRSFLRPRTSTSSFGLNGAQFFGLGFDAVRSAVESWSDTIGAAVGPEEDPESQYRFVTGLPTEDAVVAWQRRQAAKKAVVKENPNGCARAEILSESSTTARTGRITRTLVRAAEKLGFGEDGGGSGAGRAGSLGAASQQTQQAQYRQLKSFPTGHGLRVRRSHIHGWGLFAEEEFPKDAMLVEYMGEVVRQCIADLRETKYEEMGVGSCYLFRSDADAIVDATRKGNLARFINHCCDPNAIARIVNIDSVTKKIIIVAKRNIKPGEEVTYDYKFEREDGQLSCHCGAACCQGSMN